MFLAKLLAVLRRLLLSVAAALQLPEQRLPLPKLVARLHPHHRLWSALLISESGLAAHTYQTGDLTAAFGVKAERPTPLEGPISLY